MTVYQELKANMEIDLKVVPALRKNTKYMDNLGEFINSKSFRHWSVVYLTEHGWTAEQLVEYYLKSNGCI